MLKEEPVKMTTLSFSIDENLDNVIRDLQIALKVSSRADVFRLAITLMKVAVEARDQDNLKIGFFNGTGTIVREIVLP